MADTAHPANRALIADARGDDRYLRVSWHPEDRQFGVSTWDGERCVCAVRVMADAAPALIALLAEGLGDTAAGHRLRLRRTIDRSA
jgi:hypothetical protein